MRKIRNKILVPVTLIVCISLLLLGGVSIFMSVKSTNATLEQTMAEAARLGAERVSQELERYRTVAVETGCTPQLADAGVSVSDKKLLIYQVLSAYGFDRGDIIASNGKALLNGNDYSDRDYFARAMKGESVVTDPIISKTTGELSVIVAAPLWREGRRGSVVEGVVFFVPKETFLNDIVSSINVSTNGSAYMVNKDGTTIAHRNIELVKAQDNDLENAKTNSKLEPLAALTRQMISGVSGFGTYQYDGITKFLSYAPVAASDGWALAINAPTSDFMGTLIVSVGFTIGLLVLSVIIAVLLVLRIANRISRPIVEIERAAVSLSQGDLKASVTYQSQDELGRLAEAIRGFCTRLQTIISDERYLLGEMANGNFDLRSDHADEYVGDFQALLLSMRQINSGLSETLSQINNAADQVSSGSDQVSAGAQALSQGTTEQASSVQELAATINEISHNVKQNAENATAVNRLVAQTGADVGDCNQQMEQMVDAMQRISQSSSEIGKIIKTIEDIAFQTNILALNAAVEAARAGAAGKGFAVVADEVRNLASKSAEAAKNTTGLIEHSLKSVEEGAQIADTTQKSLIGVVEGAAQIGVNMEKISAASNEQANAVAQVTLGIDQISSVVQTNSATSEQSAAASEELSSQAQLLKDLVSRFKLRQSKQSANQLADVERPKDPGRPSLQWKNDPSKY